ncbi:MAG: hypothetical protein KDI44_01880 [Thiothrix sp.]|nr:hypothetical protein [Thiothrix sp.]HPQ95514.1 hypothetical protein [Thiolinea sp.]
MDYLHQTALLCRLDWQEPVHSHGMTYIPGVHDESVKAEVEARAKAQAERLITTIRELGVPATI